MASLRERFLKFATAAHPIADAEDLGYLTDPKIPFPSKDRLHITEKLKLKQSSLRRRFARSLDRRRSFPGWQPIEHDAADSDIQEHHPTFIRKGINSFSSLRDRFSSDISTESDVPSHRPSVIRKSISSMSSSLRGIRTSISSRPSRDGSTQYQTSAENTGVLSNFSNCPRRNNLDHIPSNTSSAKSSVPRLPDLDTMVANSQVRERYTQNRSPNTLFSMSIFDSLDGPFITNRNGNSEAEKDGLKPRSSPPNAGRFPVRIKRTDSTTTEKMEEPRVSLSLSTIASDQELSDWEAYGIHNPTWEPEATKVPVDWIDYILETSVTARDQALESRKSTSDDENKEKLRRKETTVYVSVPDKNDNTKPWPRNRYPDLETALKDLCARFKPYYASVAAFTPETRKIQLFPSNFNIPVNRCLIPGTVIFNVQDAMDNWYAGSPIDGACGHEHGMDDATTTEADLSSLNSPEVYMINEYEAPRAYDSDSMNVALSINDNNIREPKPPVFAAPKLGNSEESLMTDDYDMAIASRMGYVP
ncbi:hypothetical protein F4811DRAFT_568149 [Daldinia bambusicola]|nr:hypothetical protein F4811DRAFT_568149 [Daldinia bambusicola]